MPTKVSANTKLKKLKTNKDVLQLEKKSSTINTLNNKIIKIDAHVFKKKKKTKQKKQKESHTVVRPNKNKKTKQQQSRTVVSTQ